MKKETKGFKKLLAEANTMLATQIECNNALNKKIEQLKKKASILGFKNRTLVKQTEDYLKSDKCLHYFDNYELSSIKPFLDDNSKQKGYIAEVHFRGKYHGKGYGMDIKRAYTMACFGKYNVNNLQYTTLTNKVIESCLQMNISQTEATT